MRTLQQVAIGILVLAALFGAAWVLDEAFADGGDRGNDVSRGLSQFRQTCTTEPTWAIRFNADGSSTFVATCSPARK